MILVGLGNLRFLQVYPSRTGVWEHRNHCLKFEPDYVRIGIGIKIFMKCGMFCKRSSRWVFDIHTAIERKHSFCFRISFHSRCVAYENCKRPRRNYTLKCENCFAILISVCNFHISLQFSRFGVSSSLGNKTVTGSDRSCISSASFGIQIM
jgi:hypothetical protein